MKKFVIIGLIAVAVVAAVRLIKKIEVRVFEEDESEDEEAAGPDSEPGSAGSADPGRRVRPPVGLDVLKKVDEILKHPELFVPRSRPQRKGDQQ